jgi:hypothetical protein
MVFSFGFNCLLRTVYKFIEEAGFTLQSVTSIARHLVADGRFQVRRCTPTAEDGMGNLNPDTIMNNMVCSLYSSASVRSGSLAHSITQ